MPTGGSNRNAWDTFSGIANFSGPFSILTTVPAWDTFSGVLYVAWDKSSVSHAYVRTLEEGWDTKSLPLGRCCPMPDCKSRTFTIPSEAHCTYCYAAELEAENARLKGDLRENRINLLKAQLSDAQTERDMAEAQLAEAQQLRKDWEPWMATMGRLTIKYQIAHFPDDVERAFRERDEAVAWCRAVRRSGIVGEDEGSRCKFCRAWWAIDRDEGHVSWCPFADPAGRSLRA